MKKLHLIFASGALALAVSGCTDATDLPPGKYSKTTRSTDEYGTTIEKKKTTNVTVDKYGKKKAVVEDKTTEDPKGLFNKSTTDQSKQVVEEK